MFKRTLALAVATALLGLGPVAASAKTHHHHMSKHHMMSSSMSGRHSMMMHKTPCRDKKTGRYVKCAG